MGGEFLAARSTLIELLQEARAAPATPDPEQDTAAADEQQEQQQGQHRHSEQHQGLTWLQLCFAADMPVTDTLLNLWASMSPWQRLRMLWELVCVVLWKVRHGADQGCCCVRGQHGAATGCGCIALPSPALVRL